jgi:serine protease Do
MKLKSLLLVVVVSAATAFLSIWGYSKYNEKHFAGIQEAGKLPVNYAGFFDKPAAGAVPDFSPAATSATPAVVHIKTRTKARQVTNNLPNGSARRNPFAELFGDEYGDFFSGPRVQTIPEQRASGSGVFISQDGYIVTNNHVVEGADEVSITLANKHSYTAKVVATDPKSDIAVIKVEGTGFPYLIYGNSDDVKLGQWVMAIGYPLNLDVTVTAGIISAKARTIGINREENAIESFIQTDAAVNQGNSGGALINTNGELIGINSAIASPTGAYAGYSYAIPVNIVKKIVADLIKFGTVQRAFIGISYPNENISEEKRKELGIKDGDGVYVTDVAEDGAARSAGVKAGDFITKINGVTINSGPELQDQVARYKPGDKITVTYIRDSKESTINVALKNKSGNYNVVAASNVMDKLGAELENLDKATATKNQVAGGVVVKKIGTGALKNTRMQEGFVITSVSGQSVKTIDELKEVLKKSRGNIRLEGFYPGYEGPYVYPLAIDAE